MKRWHQSVTLQAVRGACLLILVGCATCACPQLNVGDNTEMRLNGYLGAGYSGSFNESGTGHGLFGAGDAQLSGFYYNPNFLSFTVHPFYNRNQDNATYGSVLSETGVDVSTNLFGGSHFPGSISFGKNFAIGSQYGLPGSAGLSSDSSTQTFSVTWNELLPKWPTLTGTFGLSSSSSTIQGTPGTTDTSSRILNLMSNYKVDGWGILGFLNHQNVGVTLPAFLSPTNARSDSATTSYGVSASHSLPISGMFEAGYNRTNYSSETGGYQNNGTTDTLESTASIKPSQRFTLMGQVRYTGNLIGALQQSVGGVGPLPVNQQSSHGLSLNTMGSYVIGHGFSLIGFANRQRQTFEGITTAGTQAGATLTYSYSRPLLGMFYFSFGMVNNAANHGPGGMGFVGSVNFRKQFGPWQVDGDFSYTQNVQTIVSYYTNSNYGYGGMVRRRFGANSIWTASYHGIQTGLSELPGYANRSDTFVTTLGRGRYGVSGNFSKSHGTALLSQSGVLAQNPLAPLLAPDQALYDGETYGAGASVAPIRRMMITASWYRTFSDTLTAQQFSNNNSNRVNGQMQYNLRKLSFRAGYWRVIQQVGAAGGLPKEDNTYYFTISRWFNLF